MSDIRSSTLKVLEQGFTSFHPRIVHSVTHLAIVSASGVIRSRVFPGLWLAVDALLAGDVVRVLEVLQAVVQSPEHQTFIQRLASFEQAN